MKGIIQYKSHTNTISLISSLYRHHLQCRRLSIRNIDSNPIMLKGESTSKRAVGVICCFMYLDGLTAISRKILLIWLLVLLSLTPTFISMWLVKIPHKCVFQLFHERKKRHCDMILWHFRTKLHVRWQKWDEHTKEKKTSKHVSNSVAVEKKERIKSANPNHLLSYRRFIMENIIDLCDETLSNAKRLPFLLFYYLAFRVQRHLVEYKNVI